RRLFALVAEHHKADRRRTSGRMVHAIMVEGRRYRAQVHIAPGEARETAHLVTGKRRLPPVIEVACMILAASTAFVVHCESGLSSRNSRWARRYRSFFQTGQVWAPESTCQRCDTFFCS